MKKTIIWILVFLISLNIVYAKNITFDFQSVDDLSLKNWTLIDFRNTTAHIDWEENVTTQGYLYPCSFHGTNTSFDACWTNTSGLVVTNITLGGAYTNFMSGADFYFSSSDASFIWECYYADEIVNAGTGFIYFGGGFLGACAQIIGLVGTHRGTSTTKWTFVNSGCSHSASNTNLYDDAQHWVWHKMDWARSFSWISNFTNIETITGPTGSPDNPGQRSNWFTTPANLYITKCTGRTSTTNYDPTRRQFILNTSWGTTVSAVRWYIHGRRNAIVNVTATISCDGGATWVTSYTNNSNVTCNTAGTNIRIHYNLTNASSNVSYFFFENVSAVPDTTPPEINANSYNMTSEGGAGCINWRTNKSNPCSTSDTTPTVGFTTNEFAWCAIGTQDINFSNYTTLGINRNCTIGQGTQSHTCTLVSEDELVYDTSFIYISCEDTNKNQNLISTSGSLALSITGLESAGRTSIGLGIQNALLSGYTNYTDLQIYARNLSNSQVRGTFDRAAKKGSKMWAFNRIGVSDSHVNMFNLTPVLYTLEFANTTSSQITLQVELLVNVTK